MLVSMSKPKGSRPSVRQLQAIGRFEAIPSELLIERVIDDCSTLPSHTNPPLPELIKTYRMVDANDVGDPETATVPDRVAQALPRNADTAPCPWPTWRMPWRYQCIPSVTAWMSSPAVCSKWAPGRVAIRIGFLFRQTPISRVCTNGTNRKEGQRWLVESMNAGRLGLFKSYNETPGLETPAQPTRSTNKQEITTHVEHRHRVRRG